MMSANNGLPRKVGRFEPKRVLGRGSSGSVYLALDTFTGDEIALKVLDHDVLADPDFEKTRARQFMNEASLAGRLSHPHIAAILDASVDESSGYIAIEYVAGGDLCQYVVPEKLLTVEDVIEVGFKVCGALDYAHRQDIVHRDIKPANIMVVDGTDVKVTDFGAAYLRKADVTQIADIGSPLYMSPEQLSGKELGHQSDMFSLGVVLYELLTGRRPFTAEGLTDLFAKILNETPAPPSQLRSGIHADIDAIILRMLAKSPSERYANWADLALELVSAGRLSSFVRAIPDREKFASLRRIVAFKGLDDAGIWELVRASEWSRVPAQTVLMREGDQGNALYLLAEGGVNVTKQGRLLNVLSAGEYFGEMSYVMGGHMRRQATAESSTEALIARFEPAALQNVSKACQLQLSNVLLRTLVERLSLAGDRLVRTPT